MTTLRALTGVAVMCGAAAGCTTREPPIRFGTTYTVQQSGALAVVESLWAERREPALRTVIGPSGLILRNAANGDLDVVLTHAPSLEARILAPMARSRCPLLESRFAIVGPAADPAHVREARSAVAALRRIRAVGALFVSRGDSSGTHVKERELWARAGITPAGDWYFESGSDQTSTLKMAEEWGAYALADLPTISRVPNLHVAVLFDADTALINRYTLYLTATAPLAAERFAGWLADSGRVAVIAGGGLKLPDGSPAFEVAAATCGAPTASPPRGGPARRASPPTVGAGRHLMGTWRYTGPRPPARPPTLGGGLHVTVRFDSAAADSFFGHVELWFAGDLGSDGRGFGRIRGRVRSDTVAFNIPLPGEAPRIEIRSALVGDTLMILESRQGSDTGPFATGPRGVFLRIAP